jgi:hypothetical protein
VVVASAEVIVNDYLPSEKADTKNLQTSILGENTEDPFYSEVVSEIAIDEERIVKAMRRDPVVIRNYFKHQTTKKVAEEALEDFEDQVTIVQEPVTVNDPADNGIVDFEDRNPSEKVADVYLNNEMVVNAGFANGYTDEMEFNQVLFKTINLSDLSEFETKHFYIRTAESLMAKVYVFKPSINASVNDMFNAIKLRANSDTNVTINETNEFGIGSFYINDVLRPDTAFLTVRISGLVYSFSYPKEFHSQIKNLIQLIEWQLG